MIKNFLFWIRCYFSNKEIYTTMYRIYKWHKKTFPELIYSDQIIKLKEEINEYNDAFRDYTVARSKTRKDACKRHVQEELTDVIIASINCMRYQQIREKVAVKMAINEHRTFKNNHHLGTKR